MDVCKISKLKQYTIIIKLPEYQIVAVAFNIVCSEHMVSTI